MSTSSVRNFYQTLGAKLTTIYPQHEAQNIASILIEETTGYSKMRFLMEDIELDENQFIQLMSATKRLLQHEPLQHVLGKAWFYNLEFHVNSSVLIPRPETEELVQWIIENSKTQQRLLDIGTGSGCIPITLSKHTNRCNISGFDISEKALIVAEKNNSSHAAEVHFRKCDILQWNKFVGSAEKWDIIISNPPYIRESEAKQMQKNVLQNEPHIALFVPDNDALLFYYTIADFAKKHLNSGGYLFFEINEAYGSQTVKMLAEKGFTGIELRKDIHQKDRMIMASL